MKHRRSVSESSSSSEESRRKNRHNKREEKKKVDDKKLDDKVDKKLNRAENKLENKVEKKIHKAEDALEHKINKKMNKLEDELEDELFDDLYDKLAYEFKSDGCLFVNGSDAYGSYWSKDAQIVTASQPIILTNSDTVLNIDQKPMSGELYICRDGIYKLELTAVFDQSGAIALAVNNNIVQSTVTVVYPNAVNVVQRILPLKRGTVVKFLNYDLSGMSILTTPVLPWNATNVSLTIFKIGPWNKKFGGCCAIPPTPHYRKCKKDEDSSDSDASSLTCKKDRKNKKKERRGRSRCSSKSSRSSKSSCTSRTSRSSKTKSMCSHSSSEYSVEECNAYYKKPYRK
jgi:hypothetical protein